jgi:hypothetical protein
MGDKEEEERNIKINIGRRGREVKEGPNKGGVGPTGLA